MMAPDGSTGIEKVGGSKCALPCSRRRYIEMSNRVVLRTHANTTIPGILPSALQCATGGVAICSQPNVDRIIHDGEGVVRSCRRGHGLQTGIHNATSTSLVVARVHNRLVGVASVSLTKFAILNLVWVIVGARARVGDLGRSRGSQSR
ncbi:hypothetical protein P280DRAFT_283734 [Massarina eburnea CBS 473.64]|uniref:Uncharacterized protein n=1 Tax=Massarina eburnea CBS 473.64 TaxID=1395130 RepID=A0A6A6S2F5_9PLEO|nr:hypothetical protein P280DRAFT_283734 [Massarina eburnea CBS 473.64]